MLVWKGSPCELEEGVVTLPAICCEPHKMMQVPERTLAGCGVACGDSCLRIYCIFLKISRWSL